MKSSRLLGVGICLMSILDSTSALSVFDLFSAAKQIGKSLVSSSDAELQNAISSPTFAARTDSIQDIKAATEIPNAYIVQLQPGTAVSKRSGSEHEEFHKRATEKFKYSTRVEFKDSSIFYGISLQAEQGIDLATIKTLPNVVNVWPIRQIPNPNPARHLPNSGKGSGWPKTHRNPQSDSNYVHTMTGVDKLHSSGVKGRGIKVAIVDSGVDYKHPALGGCFGEGCKVGFGYSFVDDDGNPANSSDPLASCADGGHGTHVSGIVGMQDPADAPFGLVGVAPEATLGMYRVFGCGGSAATDIILQAFEKAVQDGADIISASLGGYGAWEANDPFGPVTAAIEAKGVAVIVANGNSGGDGVATVTPPGVGAKVIGVGSVENIKYPAVYPASDSAQNTFSYAGTPWPFTAPVGGLKVYDISTGFDYDYAKYGCDDSFYSAAASKVSDLNNTVLLVRRGVCALDNRANSAASYGFKSLLAYSVDYIDVFAKDYGTIEPSSDFQLTTVNVEDGAKIVSGLAQQGDSYRLYFNSSSYSLGSMSSGCFSSNFTSYGPSWELHLKPQLSAPGGKILATWPLEASGYAVLSGTSMATPYISGVYALIKSVNPSLQVQDIREILQSTARPLKYIYDQSILHTTAAQGAGIVNAYSAVTYKTRIEGTQMDLGDTDSLAPQNFTIQNNSPYEKTYTITHNPAGLVRYFPYPDNPVAGVISLSALGIPDVPVYASASLTTSEVTVAAGGKAMVDVNFTPPSGERQAQIPFYSGFIGISSSDNEQLSIPYIGLPYSLYKADYLDLSNITGTKLPFIGIQGATAAEANTGYANYTFDSTGSLEPILVFRNLQPIPLARIDIVHVDTTFIPNYYGFDRNVTYPNIVKPNITTKADLGGFQTLGMITGSFLPQAPSIFFNYFRGPVFDESFTLIGNLVNGDYRPIVSVLRYGGDKNKLSDYVTWLGPIMAMRGLPN